MIKTYNLENNHVNQKGKIMEQEILDEISVSKMMEHVKRISHWERLSGSEDEWKAFQYQKKVLENLGYNVRLEKHDAYISLPLESEIEFDGMQIPSRAHSMSADTHGKFVEGPLIYLDKTLMETSENLADSEIQGKVVAFDGRAIYKKVAKAEKAGALAVIALQDDPLRECIPSGAWGSPTTSSKRLLPRIPVVSVNETYSQIIRQTVQEKRADGSEVPIKIKVKMDNGWRKIPSLTAEIKASIPTEKFVVFSGHLDSWYYGATDNGTVNAAQLEVARIVAKHKDQLRHNFRVINFSGHSHGRYAGSAWYFIHYWEEMHRNCIVNVNADTIGGKDANDITRSIIMPETKPLAKEIIKRQTGVEFKGTRCQRVADQSFWPCGVSSAFASFSKQVYHKRPDGTLYLDKGNADLGWWWHTPLDTIDVIDPVNYLRDVKIFLEYIWTFLTAPVLPLHFDETAQSIAAAIDKWRQKAGKRVDLSKIHQKSVQLVRKSKMAFAPGKIEKMGDNRILKMGRILVPLYFTTGNLYHNDDALSYPEVPSLMKIDELLKTEEHSDRSYELTIEIEEKINYVNDSLNQALELLESVLEQGA